MIGSSIHAQIHTQKASNQYQPVITQASQIPSAAKDNDTRTIVTLTEDGKAAAKLDKANHISNPLSNVTMLTDKGSVKIDLDSYFSNSPSATGFLNVNDLPPLLLPSTQNISALTEHVSTRFKQLLEDYNIPSAPEKITFDNEGKMQIPMDYSYANELNQALEENTGLARELRTLNAISSHAAEIQERMPFIEEMGNASSKAETDRIIAKYSHLLQDNNSYKSMALILSTEGDVSVTADGEPIKLT